MFGTYLAEKRDAGVRGHKKRGEEMPMEAYPGLAIPVPTITLNLLHQAANGVSPERYAEQVGRFHQGLRRQLAALSEQYAHWLEQALEAATERATALLADMPAGAARRGARAASMRPTVRAALEELAQMVSMGELLRLRGLAEVVYQPKVVGSDDVSKLTSDGRDYLASLGMQVSEPGRTVQETLLVFDGALMFDVLEGVVHDWMTVYAGEHPPGPDLVRRRVFTSANLLYAAGDVLSGAPAPEAAAGSLLTPSAQAPPAGQPQAVWEGVIFFDKGAGSYDAFRAELRAACTQAHTQLQIEPLSLWQRKLGASAGREFALRFRLPRDETLLFHLLRLLRSSGQAGRESIIKRGKMLLGQRVL
jgi:hypothetical protein